MLLHKSQELWANTKIRLNRSCHEIINTCPVLLSATQCHMGANPQAGPLGSRRVNESCQSGGKEVWWWGTCGDDSSNIYSRQCIILCCRSLHSWLQWKGQLSRICPSLFWTPYRPSKTTHSDHAWLYPSGEFCINASITADSECDMSVKVIESKWTNWYVGWGLDEWAGNPDNMGITCTNTTNTT